MSKVPQRNSRSKCSVPCPELAGLPMGEILTQKGDKDHRMLPNPSAQFGVVAIGDSTGSSDGSSDPRDC